MFWKLHLLYMLPSHRHCSPHHRPPCWGSREAGGRLFGPEFLLPRLILSQNRPKSLQISDCSAVTASRSRTRPPKGDLCTGHREHPQVVPLPRRRALGASPCTTVTHAAADHVLRFPAADWPAAQGQHAVACMPRDGSASHPIHPMPVSPPSQAPPAADL